MFDSKVGLCESSVAFGGHAKHLLISISFLLELRAKVFFGPMAPTSLGTHGMPMVGLEATIQESLQRYISSVTLPNILSPG